MLQIITIFKVLSTITKHTSNTTEQMHRWCIWI